MADENFFLDLQQVGVKGNCTQAQHLNWLVIDNWNFVMNQQAEPATDGGMPKNTAASGTFSFQIKYTDPMLFANCASGNVTNAVVTFHAQRTGITQPGSAGTAGKETAATFFELQFRGVLIHAWNLSGDEGQKTEDVHFAFEWVQMKYIPVAKQGNNWVLDTGKQRIRNYDTKALEAQAT